MKLVAIRQDELKVGSQLPWTLYNSSGEILLKIGSAPTSAVQIKNLLDNGACRDDEPPEQPASPASSDTPQRASNITTLEQIKLNIGDTLQLQFQSESDTSRCNVTLIGYLADQGVIVSTPMLNGVIMMVREGQIFVVRLFSGKSAYAFTATADKITNSPYPHMHLTYPKEVRGLIVRGSSRAPANIICHASSAEGKGCSCIARDISTGGALIAAREKIGEVGGQFALKLRVRVNDAEHMLTLDCQIRSLTAGRPGADDTPTILHGLSFENISAHDSLVISALLYQNLVNEKTADE